MDSSSTPEVAITASLGALLAAWTASERPPAAVEYLSSCPFALSGRATSGNHTITDIMLWSVRSDIRLAPLSSPETCQ